MKQLVLQSELDKYIVTTTETKPKDVLTDDAIVLAINKTDKTTCYIVKEYNLTYDNNYHELKLISPYFWLENASGFKCLHEILCFYDLLIFEDVTSLRKFMSNNKLEWAGSDY